MLPSLQCLDKIAKVKSRFIFQSTLGFWSPIFVGLRFVSVKGFTKLTGRIVFLFTTPYATGEVNKGNLMEWRFIGCILHPCSENKDHKYRQRWGWFIPWSANVFVTDKSPIYMQFTWFFLAIIRGVINVYTQVFFIAMDAFIQSTRLQDLRLNVAIQKRRSSTFSSQL